MNAARTNVKKRKIVQDDEEAITIVDASGFTLSPEQLVDLRISHQQPDCTLITIQASSLIQGHNTDAPIQIEINAEQGELTFHKSLHFKGGNERRFVLTKSQKWQPVEEAADCNILRIELPFKQFLSKRGQK